MNRKDYNVKFFDILNFILLYIVPLMVMTVSIDFHVERLIALQIQTKSSKLDWHEQIIFSCRCRCQV